MIPWFREEAKAAREAARLAEEARLRAEQVFDLQTH